MLASITEKYCVTTLDDFYMDISTANLLRMFIYNVKKLNIIIHGPSGAGKTAILNIIIKNYYGNHYTNSFCENNVLYINNSKDQGINYFRTDVKTFCQTPCSTNNMKKIVAIDDIDCLNEQSQQVFRSYIDNYSHGIFFIFTCTNLPKIIESIQSRQSIIKIPGIDNNKLIHICDTIIEGESINIEPQAKKFLIKISNGSVRVLFNYIEKFRLYGGIITHEIAVKLCTNINFDDFRRYIQHVKTNDMFGSIQILNSMYDDGYSVMDILDAFFVFIKMTPDIDERIKYDVISYICKYIHVFHEIHEDEVELAFFTNNIISIFRNTQ
jgi:replication factor C subunit 2/4